MSTRGDLFGEKIIPFDKAKIFVYSEGRKIIYDGRSLKFKAHPLRVDFYAELFDGVDAGEACQLWAMDAALFNFLDKRNLVNYEDN